MKKEQSKNILPDGDQATDVKGSARSSTSSRRKFLGQVGGITAATMAAGMIGSKPTAVKAATLVNNDHDDDDHHHNSGGEITPESDSRRVKHAQDIRDDAADAEEDLGTFQHPTNGDEARYSNRIGNFHKTLPHDSVTGEVDPTAYNVLLHALSTGKFADFEAVPRLTGATGRIANPLGGLTFNMDGPDSAIPIGPVPPPIASAGGAAEVVELYWESYLRDVPFTDYNTSNAIVMRACAELSSLADFQGPKIGGVVTPQTLFRYPYAGCLDGPMVSQFLYRNFTVDGIPVTPMPSSQQQAIIWNPDGTFNSYGPGLDFLTSFTEWLAVENGFANPAAAIALDGNRFMRSVRDIAQLANSDNINSVYIRASNVAGGLGAVSNGPYTAAVRQSGFCALNGGGWLSALLGNVHKGERYSWFTKWQLHRHLRPEAFGGLVDRTVQGVKSYPLHTQLLNSDIVQNLIGPYNQHMNNVKFGSSETTFLLPQASRGGSPSHPSASAGHACTAGACVTLLKYWFVDATIPQGSLANTTPKQPNRDGSALLNYVYGVDGPPLTVHGELNKLCANISEGRNMLGFHYRVSDDYSGNIQGEAAAIRLLKEATALYPEPDFPITFNKFDGTPVTI